MKNKKTDLRCTSFDSSVSLKNPIRCWKKWERNRETLEWVFMGIYKHLLEYEGLHIINTPEVLIQNLQVYLYFL